VRPRRPSGASARPFNFTVRGNCSGDVLDVSSSFFPVTRFQEPFVSAAVGATASARERHCLVNRPGITAPVAAADAGVAPLRRREHSASAASFVAALRSTSELRAGAR